MTYKLASGQGGKVVHEVILDRVNMEGRTPWTHGRRGSSGNGLIIADSPQSHPVFLPGAFLGVEHPVSSVRVSDGQVLRVGFRPYAVQMQHVLAGLAGRVDASIHPLLTVRESSPSSRTLIIVVTADG